MAEDTTTKVRSHARATSTGTLTQLYLGLVWLAVTMWSAHAEITGHQDDVSGALGSAVTALPGVIAATLVTSASIAQAAGSRFPGAVRRLLAGLGLGLLFGVVAAVAIRLAYGSAPSITALALAVGAAGVVGGAAALLPNRVLEAGLWATTFVFLGGVVFGALQPVLLSLLGGGPNATLGKQVAAASLLPAIQSVLTGLIAGYFALQNMRSERRSRLWYLLAGGLPGLLLLVAEVLTRLGGASVLKIVRGSLGESALVGLTDAARVKHALIVLVVGGILAMVAVRREPAEQPHEPEDPTDD